MLAREFAEVKDFEAIRKLKRRRRGQRADASQAELQLGGELAPGQNG